MTQATQTQEVQVNEIYNADNSYTVITGRVVKPFYIANPKATSFDLTFYTRLYTVKKPNWAHAYLYVKSEVEKGLQPVNEAGSEFTIAARHGSIVFFYYRTGSHKRAYTIAYAYGIVDGVSKATIRHTYDNSEMVLELEGVRLIDPPTKTDETKAEAELKSMNIWPSDSTAPWVLYDLYIIAKRLREEEARKEAEVSLEEAGLVEAAPVNTQSIPIPQRELTIRLEEPTPVGAQAPQGAQEAQAKPGEVEKPRLVKVYALAMSLPTRHLIGVTEYEHEQGGVVEVRRWEGELAKIASRIEGIRRAAYEKISRMFVYSETFNMWVAVSEDAVKLASAIGEWVREQLRSLGLDRFKRINLDYYGVRAVPIYLEPMDAKALLESAIMKLRDDISQIQARIQEAEAEEKKKALSKLEGELSFRQALLEAFRKYLAQVSE
jgi:hypothetical protein